MELETAEIEGSRGVRLFVRDHRPQDDQNARTLLWIHGLGEHGGRYRHISDWMVERGWRVIVCDLRGHGRLSGTRTHVLSFDEYSADLAKVWDHFELKRDQTVVFGHSMGGLVAIRSVQTGSLKPSALVLSSPLLGLKVQINPIKYLLGQLVVRFLPETRFRNGLDPTNMTRDPQFALKRQEDPLIVKTVTAGWFFAMERAIAAAHRDVQKITIPILAFRGMSDETTDGDVLSVWLSKTNSSLKELISLPAHLHEVFHESDWKIRSSGWQCGWNVWTKFAISSIRIWGDTDVARTGLKLAKD